jgi:hypothetical protein
VLIDLKLGLAGKVLLIVARAAFSQT